MKSLESLLTELSQIGPMFLHKSDKGTWSCTVELPAPAGNKFECKSGYGHETPNDALAACLANVPTGFTPTTVEVVVEKTMPNKASFLAGYQQAFNEATEIVRTQ